MGCKNQCARGGFSLLEILVAVAILAVLAALIFATYRSVSQAAAQVECANRLRHIYGATLAYVGDYSGLMYPDLGPRTDIRSDYNLNQYWWNQAYLGRYVLGQMSRRRDSLGAMSQEETEPFNCPLRFVDGTDQDFTQSNGNPGTSYVMRRQTPATSVNSPQYRIDFQFHSIHEPSRQVLITEGRHRIALRSAAQTGEGRDSANRLRRYHKGGMNVLFYDGRIELFTAGDDVLKQEYWNALRQ
jgi:prepilin-type N-terminal cleavage/methylation domain-containing protein/prepilin-type processing-associated H-X9-DG protein